MSAVFIAGRALISALGPDLPAAVAALRSGTAPRLESIVVANQLEGDRAWPLRAVDEPSGEGWMARASRLAHRAAHDSGALDHDASRDGALFIATTSCDTGDREERGDYADDMQAFAERIGAALGWRGPVHTVLTACTSGFTAMLDAAASIDAGRVANALVLGIELRNRLTVAGFASLQRLAPDANAPGMRLGEAVAALHLTRGPARWRFAGGAGMVDGRDAMNCSPQALAESCVQALARSGVEAAAIGRVKRQSDDAAESAALAQVFGAVPPSVGFEAQLGQVLAAAGVAETALLLACAEAEPSGVRHTLACSFGFGGMHAACVLEDRAAFDAAPPASTHRDVEPRVLAHTHAVPPEWRARLATRLGYRPRRIGRWAELALHGARECLDAAGLATLPLGACLRVGSLRGTLNVAHTAIAHALEGRLTPFEFLQSQPSQLLAVLSEALGWQGDARLLLTRDRADAWALATLALRGPHAASGVLLGWVEEAEDEAAALGAARGSDRSEWWWLAP